MDSAPNIRNKLTREVYGGVPGPMPRGYRYFILAAVGCLAVAALLGWLLQPEQPHFAGDRGYQGQAASYQAGGADCKPSALDALPAGERQAKRDACNDAQEQHREAANSLIEARRSADAADASAVAAYKQAGIAAWATAIGLLTLFAAIGAALFAERAAFHTKRGADAAAHAVQAQIDASRPIMGLVSFKVTNLRKIGEDNYCFDYVLRAKNLGNVGCWVEEVAIGISTPEQKDTLINTDNVNCFVSPKGGVNLRSRSLIYVTQPQGQGIITIIGHFVYRDAGRRRWKTGYSYLLYFDAMVDAKKLAASPDSAHWIDERLDKPD